MIQFAMRRAPPLVELPPVRIAVPLGHSPLGLALSIAGEQVLLLPDRALFWNGILAIADVHLGKGDHFRAAGLPLPPGELDDDLARLTALVAVTGAHTVRVLGDLVHGVVKAATEARVAEWRTSLPAALELVPGNHDRHQPVLPASWDVEVLAALVREGPFAFSHAPAAVPGALVWAGHVHPTATLSGRADRLRLPAFVLAPGLGLLPAFSRFTGGPTIRAAPGFQRYLCVEGEVVALDDAGSADPRRAER